MAEETTDSLHKSNSLYDVSGLQSLEVIKKIQTHLNSPTASMENIHKSDKLTQKEIKSIQAENKPKTYQYRGPPSINMGTWNDRPKNSISLQENNLSSKLIVTTTHNSITSNNIAVKTNTSPSFGAFAQPEPKNVTIKVNGTEPISTQKSGNVVIKIGSSKNNVNNLAKYGDYTTPLGYRTVLNNMRTSNNRPHSVALDSDFDTSRVPIVRSVEFKKPYKDMNNTSITQIYQGYNNTNGIKSNTLSRNDKHKFEDQKNLPSNRFSWNCGTLPAQPKKDIDGYATNKDVPFSQSNLRRTDSKKLIMDSETNGYQKDNVVDVNNLKNNVYNLKPVKKIDEVKPPSPPVNIPPPPPPQLMKVEVKKPRQRQIEPTTDPRDELLASIRNFGGKKGLKSLKS